MRHGTYYAAPFVGFLDSIIFGTFIFIPKSLRRLRTSSCKDSIARRATCQHAGTPGQSASLLQEPADADEALRKTRCDRLFRGQSHPEQVTFTSVPAPPDPSLAQLPHRSSSSAPGGLHCHRCTYCIFCDRELQCTTAASRVSRPVPRGITEKVSIPSLHAVMPHSYVTNHCL